MVVVAKGQVGLMSRLVCSQTRTRADLLGIPVRWMAETGIGGGSGYWQKRLKQSVSEMKVGLLLCQRLLRVPIESGRESLGTY